MIVSFADDDTEKVFQGFFPACYPSDIITRAHRKLRMIAAAINSNDLRLPPGNRLEELQGDRAGQFSIRINDQWRICFRWDAGNAYDVEISKHYE